MAYIKAPISFHRQQHSPIIRELGFRRPPPASVALREAAARSMVPDWGGAK